MPAEPFCCARRSLRHISCGVDVVRECPDIVGKRLLKCRFSSVLQKYSARKKSIKFVTSTHGFSFFCVRCVTFGCGAVRQVWFSCAFFMSADSLHGMRVVLLTQCGRAVVFLHFMCAFILCIEQLVLSLCKIK